MTSASALTITQSVSSGNSTSQLHENSGLNRFLRLHLNKLNSADFHFIVKTFVFPKTLLLIISLIFPSFLSSVDA